jgi:hypothetical protein
VKASEREAIRVARLAIGRTTEPNGRTIEWAEPCRFYPDTIIVRFAGTGLAPFREARYAPREVLKMIGGESMGADRR